ncbi:MAG: hypothetical protein L6R30_26415 [Thermoanaerobaculia bacterium]|nr:hypothetical protein [Thermoanaerobaculia bacterium]
MAALTADGLLSVSDLSFGFSGVLLGGEVSLEIPVPLLRAPRSLLGGFGTHEATEESSQQGGEESEHGISPGDSR